MGVIAKGILRGCQGLFTPVSLGYPLSVFNKNSTLKWISERTNPQVQHSDSAASAPPLAIHIPRPFEVPVPYIPPSADGCTQTPSHYHPYSRHLLPSGHQPSRLQVSCRCLSFSLESCIASSSSKIEIARTPGKKAMKLLVTGGE